MSEIKWEKVRPSEDEFKEGIDGVRAQFEGAQLEVRFTGYNPYEHEAAYVEFTVSKMVDSVSFLAVGKEFLDELYSRPELEQVYEKSKKRAEAVARCFAKYEVVE